MINQNDSNFPLKYQATMYATMALISGISALLGIFYFKDVTVFSASALLFSFTWPLAIAAFAGYLVEKTMSFDDQLEQFTDGEMEDAMEELTEMFKPVEDETGENNGNERTNE